MKIMRVVRNMNAISTFLRNAGLSKSAIVAINMTVLLGLLFIGVVLLALG